MGLLRASRGYGRSRCSVNVQINVAGSVVTEGTKELIGTTPRAVHQGVAAQPSDNAVVNPDLSAGIYNPDVLGLSEGPGAPGAMESGVSSRGAEDKRDVPSHIQIVRKR
jgi:hypothetical protein